MGSGNSNSGFKGPKTPEVLEQEMFSLLNMIIKRDYYQKEKQAQMKLELKNLMRDYLKDD